MSEATYAPSFAILLEGTELRHGVTVDVLSLSVTETFNQADSFSFSVRDRHPESGHFAGGASLRWMDDPVFDQWKEVTIDLGYAGRRRRMMVGEVTSTSPSFPQGGMPTLSVRGRSLYNHLQLGTRRQPFEAATDSGIAEEIAGALGFSSEVDVTTAEHPLISPDGATYDAILRQRAERIGYEFTVKDHTLYFQEPRYLSHPSPVLTLEWGRSLTSFTPTLNVYNLLTKFTVRSAQTSQGGGKEALVGTAEAGDERVKLGTTAASELARPHEVEEEQTDVASQAEANDIALARLEKSSLGLITGSGSAIGSPELEPRAVIALAGLGERFSGDYYVTSVTHSLGGSGYRTTFEVRRNAL